jgi:hypothetical protein
MLVYARFKGFKPMVTKKPTIRMVTFRCDDGHRAMITFKRGGHHSILHIHNRRYPITHARVINLRADNEPLAINTGRLPSFLTKAKFRANDVRFHSDDGLYVYLTRNVKTWFGMPVEAIHLHINPDVIERPSALVRAIKRTAD